MEATQVLGRPDGGPAVIAHDHIADWADCSVCGAHLDRFAAEAPEGWDGSCWHCGAPAVKVGLRDLRHCVACGEAKPRDAFAGVEHNTGGEAICLECHQAVIASDSDSDCPGCRVQEA